MSKSVDFTPAAASEEEEPRELFGSSRSALCAAAIALGRVLWAF